MSAPFQAKTTPLDPLSAPLDRSARSACSKLPAFRLQQKERELPLLALLAGADGSIASDHL